jgi:hypothetical protein
MVAKTYDPKTMALAAEYPFEVMVQSSTDPVGSRQGFGVKLGVSSRGSGKVNDSGFDNAVREMMDWCNENCVFFWMLGPVLPIKVFETWTYNFAFVDEQDAMFFKLRWQ